MDAIELLKSDHRKVENLFSLSRQAKTQEERRGIFKKIRNELELHTRIEETIFYPAFSQYESFDDLLDESYQEHQDIQDLIEEIAELEDTGNEDEFLDLLEDLREEVDHHVHEEEHTFFPKVRDVMDQQEISRIAQMIIDAKEGVGQKVA